MDIAGTGIILVSLTLRFFLPTLGFFFLTLFPAASPHIIRVFLMDPIYLSRAKHLEDFYAGMGAQASEIYVQVFNLVTLANALFLLDGKQIASCIV